MAAADDDDDGVPARRDLLQAASVSRPVPHCSTSLSGWTERGTASTCSGHNYIFGDLREYDSHSYKPFPVDNCLVAESLMLMIRFGCYGGRGLVCYWRV